MRANVASAAFALVLFQLVAALLLERAGSTRFPPPVVAANLAVTISVLKMFAS